jgi:tetratricopeptide (TPR) repeat protein
MDNLAAAVSHAADRDPSLVDSRVVTALADHLAARGRFGESHRVLAQVARTTGDRATRVAALLAAGIAANQYGDPRAALDLGTQALGEADRTDDRIGALNLVGGGHKALGDLTAAYTAYARCLDEAEAAGETRRVTVALNNLGTVAHDRGDYEGAAGHYLRSLEIKRGLGDERGVAVSLVNVGGLYKDTGDDVAARACLTEALEWFRRHDEPYGTAFSLALMAEVQLALGAHAEAQRHAVRAVTLATEMDHAQTRALGELALGRIGLTRRDPARAATHLRAAAARAVEPADRARILEYLAAAVVESDPAEARDLLARAEEIRRSRGYAIAPVDRPVTEATRRTLGTTPAAGPPA